jgi:hypothetical protein
MVDLNIMHRKELRGRGESIYSVKNLCDLGVLSGKIPLFKMVYLELLNPLEVQED